ncbi:MAG: ABC transporter substrate-binding protein [Magnetococcales bacterium]|nr:ABC transporter substrate-binding protein [Magnetococcales bacterium]
MIRALIAGLLLLQMILAYPSAANDASTGEIRLGLSAALSGSAAALGQGMQQGIDCLVQQVNAGGGVHGQPLRLLSMDDGYEPERAVANVQQLLERDQVLALVGNVGTPTAVVTVPMANRHRTLLFGAYTGAGLLRRSPPDRYVINFRASYAEETMAMIDGLLGRGIRPEEIAFFTQNDGYGDAGYQGAIRALKSHGYAAAEALPHGRYTRNRIHVEKALGTILDSPMEPKAIIMVGTYKPTAAFVRLARQELPRTRFLSVSFVGSEPLAQELGPDGDGVVVTQVVPPIDTDWPGVRDYHKAMATCGYQPGLVSLEGFLAARLLLLGLERAGPQPTREGIIQALESLGTVDLGLGAPLMLSAQEHQASHTVWPTVLRQGRFVAVDWNNF